MERDRRANKRVEFTSGIRYQQKSSHNFTNTIARDISNGGIGFISNEFMPKSSQLILEFNPPGYNDSKQVPGEVMWVSSQPYSERFYIGAKFLEPAA